ncbi:hypothetical protein [Cupriavidus sp. amp6]|nr:hypothetical protein [Cupriavidus sp. amp6]
MMFTRRGHQPDVIEPAEKTEGRAEIWPEVISGPKSLKVSELPQST